MDWTTDLPRWSHPTLSRRVSVRPVDWHVQDTARGDTHSAHPGDRPMVLLLHGTGASTHTWRAVLPMLADDYRVVALDLPGHGFSRGSAQRMSLQAMTEDLIRLIEDQGWQPDAIVGHSAGAAVALNVAHRRDIPKVIGLNPALEQFEGVAEWLFPVMAKLLALNPFTANMFSFAANRFQTAQILGNTGSTLCDEGLSYYTRLLQDRAHVNGALQMMASWSLTAFERKLPEITADTLLIAAANDQTIAPDVAHRAARRLPNAVVETLPDLGHLAHEEAPEAVVPLMRRFLPAKVGAPA